MNDFDDTEDEDEGDTGEYLDLAEMIGARMTGRFKAALGEHLDGLDYGHDPGDLPTIRADGLIRACCAGDDEVLGVAVLLLMALRATDGLDLALAAILDAARAVPREELARHLPAAILEAIPISE